MGGLPTVGHGTQRKGYFMRPEVIEETSKLWAAEPEKAKAKPTVRAYADGAEAVLEAASFSWRADLPTPLGGTDQAPSPTALLLGALAGCAVAFIHDTLAPQFGVRVDNVEATAQCETDFRGLLGMADVAPDLGSLRLDVRVQSPDGDAAVQQLYQAWQQRCPIYLALVKPMNVNLQLTHG
jgi:uncharacterized OsmC-like protein